VTTYDMRPCFNVALEGHIRQDLLYVFVHE
jgi:hypothetical protein